MNNIFATVKAYVTTRQAAEYYGFQVNRSSMICCPFHADKHPSMKVDERYYCFGCHETGDVINFVANLYGLTNYEAATKLAQDFGIDPHTPAPIDAKGKAIWQQRNTEDHCAAILINYELLLRQWYLRYSPATPQEPLQKRFIQACKKLPAISGFVDALYSPDEKLRKNTTEQLMKDGIIDKVEAFLERHREEVEDAQFNALNNAAA